MPSPLFSRLVNKLFPRRQSQRDRRRATRLRLEPLEGRDVPAVTFTVEDLSDATEGGSTGQFRVTADGDAADFTNAVYAVWNATGGTATYSTDFTTSLSPGNYLVFNSPGSTTTLTITAVDDSTIEGDETVGLTVQRYLMFPTGPTASDTLTLHDNDTSPPPPPPPLPVVSVTSGSDATEGGTHGTFQFTRTGATTSALTVTYTVHTGDSDDATPGDDYEELSGTVTIPVGESSATVEVAAGLDLIDPDEVVSVTVAESAGYTLGATVTAEVSILEDLSANPFRTIVLDEYYVSLIVLLDSLPSDYPTTLAQMQQQLASMEAAYGNNQSVAYAQASGNYSTLDMNLPGQLPDVLAKADAMITQLGEAAALAEGDEFRLKEIKRIGARLHSYLTDIRDRLDNLRDRLVYLHSFNGDAALEGLHYNLGDDRTYIGWLLDDYGELTFESDTESDDERVTDGLNGVSADVDVAVTDLEGRVGEAGSKVMDILAFGQTVVNAPSEELLSNRYTEYSLYWVSPLKNGVDDGPGLVEYITGPVNEVLALIDVTPSNNDPSPPPPTTGLDLANAIGVEQGVDDFFRLSGMIADLDRVLAQLDTVLAMLDAIETQNETIVALFEVPEINYPADYWYIASNLSAMKNGIEVLREDVSDVRKAIEDRLPL